MIDVFEIGASLNVHGNSLDFMQAFSGALLGAHDQLDRLEKKLGATKGAMKDLFAGAAEVFGGVEILRGLKDLAEAGKELNHQQSMLMRNGVSQRDVMRETAEIYKDMLKAVPTASAVDFLRTLGELKTVKGSIAGAREALTQSLKIEGLIGNSTGKSAEGQGYDFWRAVEDKGIIQNKEKTDAMLNRMVQGTIATGGKIGGNDWFTYARRAGSAWMGDDIEALPLQLMEMQTLGASGAGVARRAFANRIEGAIKLTKAQMAGWAQIGMLGPNGTIVGSQLEQSRPDLFLAKVIEALKAQGIDNESKVKAWAARALHGKDADYFMTAYTGMTEVDPESGLTRLQKERRNMGDAQPLDKAYATMMGTDFEANMEALTKQWKSFTEAIGAPAAKAAIPILQDVTSFFTQMAAFADQHQRWTQIGVDIAAVASGLLILGGSVRLIRGALRLMGGGLLGMGRNALGLSGSAKALGGSATALDASAAALKEAAAELRARSGMSGGSTGGGPGGPAGASPGYTPLFGRGLLLGLNMWQLADSMPDALKAAAADRAPVDPQLEREARWGDALRHWLFGGGSSSSGFQVPSAYSREARARLAGAVQPRYDAPNTDGNAIHRWEEMPAGFKKVADAADLTRTKFGDLTDKTGLVLTSFGGLGKSGDGVATSFGGVTSGSGVLANMFRVVEATGMGAARALAQIALGGGGAAGGGGGFGNASWGSGGGSRGGSGGGGGGDGSPIVGGAGTVAAGLPTEARAFLDTIASGEAHGYNVLNGGQTFGDLSHHPGTRAAGRYQDLPSTWRRISGAMGLRDFSPESQDKGNWWLAQQDYRAHTGRDLLSDLRSHDPGRIAAIGRALHSTWVSTNGSFARKFDHFMGVQRVPAVPPPPRIVSPGNPATSGSHVEAAMHNVLRQTKMEVAINYDRRHQQHIAGFVQQHIGAAMRFPRDMGGPNAHAHYVSPGTPVTDAA